MRLPTDVHNRFRTIVMVLGLSVILSACGRGGGDLGSIASASDRPATEFAYGPEADYPLVVGDPYKVGDQTYTPLDTMNYDEVGYVTIDREGGNEVSIAHKTLPLPSYVEVTSLESGKTVLARATRRGPMSNEHVAALSPGALAQLGIQPGASIRIRRTNPPESDRAKLRMGQSAAIRMDTPKSLLAVLKRNLPKSGSVSLASKAAKTPASAAPEKAAELPATVQQAPAQAAVTPKKSGELPATAIQAPSQVAAAPKAKPATFSDAFSGKRRTVTAYPLPPLAGAKRAAVAVPPRPAAASAAPRAVRITRNATPAAAVRPKQENAAQPAIEGKFVVQAAAFSSKANADRAASSIDGFVQKSGKFFRVRTGPFTNRGQAEAALAKVRAAGYDDARVFTSG